MAKHAPSLPVFPAVRHDHARCVERAMLAAETACKEQGAHLTELRRQVLSIVWSSHVPLGAYEILAAMTTGGRRPAPPTVYRALEFLLEQGLVHRIESRNAYVGCQSHCGKDHQSQFLICKLCGQTLEVSDAKLSKAIQALAKTSGFELSGQTVELQGLCPACHASQGHAAR